MRFEIFEGTVPKEAARLRQEVFVDEQGFCDEFDEFDARSTHIVMFDGDEAVATLRFYFEGEDSYHVGRVAVKKSRRGEGLGRVIMSEAVGVVSRRGGKFMTVGAQEDKAGFYSRCGFVPTGERYFEQDYPHVAMRLEIKNP